MDILFHRLVLLSNYYNAHVTKIELQNFHLFNLYFSNTTISPEYFFLPKSLKPFWLPVCQFVCSQLKKYA